MTGQSPTVDVKAALYKALLGSSNGLDDALAQAGQEIAERKQRSAERVGPPGYVRNPQGFFERREKGVFFLKL